MADADDQLRAVLEEYDYFLREKDLAPVILSNERWTRPRTRRCADDGVHHRPAFSHVVIRLPQ